MSPGRRAQLLAAAALIVVALVPLAMAANRARTMSAGNLAYAKAEAPRLLGLLQLPLGAVSSASEPAGDHGALAQPGYDEATPNLVDAHAWWTVPETARHVLAYVARSLPAKAKLLSRGTGNVAPGYESDSFSLPAIAGVLSERFLAVTVEQLSARATAVRTDGEAVWITARPSWEQIPAGIRSVTYTASGATDSGKPGPVSRPIILTGVRARELEHFINGLELDQPGARSCPEEFGTSVHLRFADARGDTVAQAVEQPTGCDSVCRLSGVAKIKLFDARGRVMHTKTRKLGAALVRREGLDAWAILDPGQSAGFAAEFTACAVPAAARVAITLPRVARRLFVSVGSAMRPLAPCRGKLGLGNLT